MINPEELAICRRRGHVPAITLDERWSRCEKCGMWLRDVVSREEREDTPPESETHPFDRLRRAEEDRL